MASETRSRFLSAAEVEACIRKAGPIFHVLSAAGKAPAELVSPLNGSANGAGPLDGFALRPPTISGSELFSTKVHSEWLRRGCPSYNGVALPGMAYVETTGTFRLDSLGPGPYPGEYFMDEAGLSKTLQSLAAVALREAVKQHLTEGGDERLHLSRATGGNKYFCPPHPVADAILRGSCTCSPPSRYAFDSACRQLESIWSGNVSVQGAYDDVRRRISKALEIRTPHHVVLHPSGTDAEFTPLIIGANKARALGCTSTVNIVVGAGEVGSNTANAAGGRHFSQLMPSGGARISESLVDDFAEETTVIELKARRPDGLLDPDFDRRVIKAMQEASETRERPFFIMHAVDGSKIGSHITTRGLVQEVQAKYGSRVLVVLDACQARTETEELDWYLSHGAVVLITASKFYGAPGFCAAALVPDSAATALQDDGAVVPASLGNYLTRFEVPSALTALHRALPSGPRNMGLLLRWACGLAEMERLAKTGAGGREGIRKWVNGARELIRQSPRLELLVDGTSPDQPSQLGGVNSILSFKLRADDGHYLGMETLRRLHKWMAADVSGLLPSSASETEKGVAALKCFIGQPVDLGDVAVLRLALGAGPASELGQEDEDGGRLETALADDVRIIDKIMLFLRDREAMSGRQA